MTTETLTPMQEQMRLIFREIGHCPLPAQWPFHDSESRIRMFAGGEGAGKSLSGAADCVAHLPQCRLVWLVGNNYEDTSEEYRYIEEFTQKLGLYSHSTSANNPPSTITLKNECRIITKTAEEPKKLGQQAPDYVLGCEAARCSMAAIDRLRGRTARNRGWLTLTGTFEGSLGWYPELFTKWQVPNADNAQSFSVPSWENIFMYPQGRTDPEILALESFHSRDYFMERYGAVPCPPQGRVFYLFQVNLHVKNMKDAGYPADQLDDVWVSVALDNNKGGTHRRMVYAPDAPVYLWIDPGYAHYHAVEVVQILGDTVYVFDELFYKGVTTEDMIHACQQRPWWPNVQRITADIAARQHAAAPAIVEIWREKTGHVVFCNKVLEEEGRERFNTFLKPDVITGRPKIYFDPYCRGIISELGGGPNPDTGRAAVYSWPTNQKGEVVPSRHPEDINNDACKAICYGLVEHFGHATARQKSMVCRRY
jgi:hypothetical protein